MRVLAAMVHAALAATLACSGESSRFELTRSELLDPDTCAGCHPVHHQQWQSSMHAYAADDPVFLALNRRGQEETGGALGDFCVQCHAPMALREGATTDGLNLEEVARELKGVTCYFCHTVAAVEGTHNNPLRLAEDQVMRAALVDPIDNGAHAKGYSELLDERRPESSDMCGACHDVVTPAGVHLERTYLEFQESVFSKPLGGIRTSCSTCHMFTEPGAVADVPGAPTRRIHSHSFPGVDLALTEWPGIEDQRAQIQRDLDAVLQARLCVNPAPGGADIDVILENVNAGHAFPSGAAHDRRAWVQLEAFAGDAELLATGRVGPDQGVVEVATSDPLLWQIRDFTYKEDGAVAKTFWDVREVDSQLLPPATTNDPNDPDFIHSRTRRYTVIGATPDRVDLQVFIRPVGFDLIDDLVASGHLDPVVRGAVPTFALASTALTWSSDDGFGFIPF